VQSPTDSHPFKPLFLINTQYDPMPYHQIIDMICALNTAGVPGSDYQTMTLMGSGQHAFGYWNDWDEVPCSVESPCTDVSQDVIAFLDAHLKN
jgi:hypothetical protein